jgi:hypothetical protein
MDGREIRHIIGISDDIRIGRVHENEVYG